MRPYCGDDQDVTGRRSDFDHGAYAAEIRRRAGPLWEEAVLALAGRGPVPERPYQVELHARQEKRPGCRNACDDCCGRFLRTDYGLPPEILLEVRADTLRMGVPSFVVSGTHTDPACLDEPLLCRLLAMSADWPNRNQSLKLYTYGEGLTPAVQDALIAAARADRTHDSYLRLSMLTLDPGIFAKMCRPHHRTLSPAEVLAQQQENTRNLLRRIREGSVPLGISLNCRLTQLNGRSPEPVAELLRWFAANLAAPATVRFTTDYVPTLAPPSYRERFFREIYVDPETAARTVRDAIRMAELTTEQRSRVSFRPVDPESSQRSRLGVCFNQYLFAAVSPEGLVYPCQGIAGKPFRHLAYGDVKEKSFVEVWSEFCATSASSPSRPILRGCARCAAACERAICEAGARGVEGLAAVGVASVTAGTGSH